MVMHESYYWTTVAIALLFAVLFLYRFLKPRFNKYENHGVAMFYFLFFAIIATAEANDRYEYTDTEFQNDYVNLWGDYNMGCYEWSLLFADEAYAERVRFLRGGDTERGELALYYLQRHNSEENCLATHAVKHKYHDHLDDLFRVDGAGGWDGEYPEKYLVRLSDYGHKYEKITT